MGSGDMRKKFTDYIMLQVYDDKYLDRKEERRILEEGVRMGVGVEVGLAVIRQVAAEKGITLEREAEERAEEMLQRFATADGRVDQKEFEDTLALFTSATKGRIPEPELKKRLKHMMEENGWQAKEGGFFGTKWYSAI